jgi:hypothetical protein
MMAQKSLADSFFAALLASLFMQAGVASFLAGHGLTASALVSIGLTILIARLKAAGILTRKRLRKLAIAVLIVAFSFELFMMFVRFRLGGAGNSPYAAEAAPGISSGKYRGVILWEDPPPHTVLVPPRLGAGRGVTKSRQQLTIPFDGVYWYFKFPDRQPPNGSYTARGSPAATTFRSADSIPLQMEARQNFITPIPMTCCGRITVEILNADRYPGTLSIDLILVNLGLPGQPSERLGPQPVTSTPQWVSGDEFQAATEVLSFAVPANPRINQFDSATVRFIRSGKRGVSSAKIAIERFTLVPPGLH